MGTRLNLRHLRPDDLVGLRWRGLVRESSEEQAERWSPERQRSDLRRAAADLGLVPAGEPLFYERVGSGEAEGVPELARALADGQAGQFDVLVVLHTSRFARNRAEAVTMKRAFRKAGIVIYFAAQRLISGTYAGGLSEGISEVIDEHENETRRMWVAGGMRERQLAGRWVGRIPFGYRKRLVDFPDGTRGWDGGLEIDPVAAPVVRRIFDDLAAGVAAGRIAIGLNAMGSRTYTGRPWTPKSIREIARNAVYRGALIRYQRERTPHYYPATDPHDGRREVGRPFPALVDPRVWEAAQPEGRGVPWRTVRHYPLSNVTRCRRCGFRMQGAFSGKHRYYRCGGRLVGVCDAPHVRADVAEGQFAEWLAEIQLPADWREAIVRTSVQSIVADESDRVRRINERLARLRNLYSWGDIGESEYREQVAALRSEAAIMVKPDMGSLERMAAVLAELGAAWSRLPVDRQRELPGTILHAAVADNGEIVEWVVRAELRPLLELVGNGVAEAAEASIRRSRYTVRFSA
jgi:site-specific DNA recombinase